MDKFLIVGLGNPGTRYAKTRHNAGTDLIDKLAENYSLDLKENLILNLILKLYLANFLLILSYRP